MFFSLFHETGFLYVVLTDLKFIMWTRLGPELQRTTCLYPKLGLNVCATLPHSRLFLKANNLIVLKRTEILSEKMTNRQSFQAEDDGSHVGN